MEKHIVKRALYLTVRVIDKSKDKIFNKFNFFTDGLDSRSKRPVGELYKDYDRYRATGAPLPLADPPLISRMTDKRLTISWKPSLPITPRAPVTYLVEMEEQPKGEWSTVRAGIRGCACDIHNLIPFRDYKFRVRVENNYGISDPSPFVLTYRYNSMLIFSNVD